MATLIGRSRHEWNLLKLPPRRVDRRLAAASRWFAEVIERGGFASQVDLLLVPSLRDEMLTITNFTGHPSLTIRAGFVEVSEARSDWAPDPQRPLATFHPPRRVPHGGGARGLCRLCGALRDRLNADRFQQRRTTLTEGRNVTGSALERAGRRCPPAFLGSGREQPPLAEARPQYSVPGSVSTRNNDTSCSSKKGSTRSFNVSAATSAFLRS